MAKLEKGLQRVVVPRGVAPVVDEIEAHVALFVGDLVERNDLPGVDDGGVETGLHALVEEHAVEHMARRRRQAERDVGHAECGEAPRDLGLDALDRVHRVHRVSSQVVVAVDNGT